MAARSKLLKYLWFIKYSFFSLFALFAVYRLICSRIPNTGVISILYAFFGDPWSFLYTHNSIIPLFLCRGDGFRMNKWYIFLDLCCGNEDKCVFIQENIDNSKKIDYNILSKVTGKDRWNLSDSGRKNHLNSHSFRQESGWLFFMCIIQNGNN